LVPSVPQATRNVAVARSKNVNSRQRILTDADLNFAGTSIEIPLNMNYGKIDRTAAAAFLKNGARAGRLT